MSWRASSWAKGVQAGSPAHKATLLILAEACDRWGYTWLGQRTIARETECCERSARQYIADMAEVGLLQTWRKRHDRGRWRALYKLGFDPKPKEPLPDDRRANDPGYVGAEKKKPDGGKSRRRTPPNPTAVDPENRGKSRHGTAAKSDSDGGNSLPHKNRPAPDGEPPSSSPSGASSAGTADGSARERPGGGDSDASEAPSAPGDSESPAGADLPSGHSPPSINEVEVGDGETASDNASNAASLAARWRTKREALASFVGDAKRAHLNLLDSGPTAAGGWF